MTAYISQDVIRPTPIDENAVVTVVERVAVAIEVAEQGPPGPAGSTGPQGPAGPATNAAYVHDQTLASDTWVVVHNLGFHPNVTTVDSLDREFEATLAYDSFNQLTITLSTAISGKAYLS